ncbi:MAG: D-glycero-beta-D-manno-heptose-7-phosphate kinase [Elusimicrobiota bacterium]
MIKINDVINEFKKIRVLVIGDSMMDKFIHGKVTRLSPEAPVPIVKVEREVVTAGGAGNVAMNITSLGAKVNLVSIIGDDGAGSELQSKLRKSGVEVDGLIVDENRPTTIKTRVIGNHQQVVRFDNENTDKISSPVLDEIFKNVENYISEVDSVVISDYGKGIISGQLLNNIIKKANSCKKPILVDPKIEHFLFYQRVTCLTPNLNEAINGMHYKYPINNNDDIKNLGNEILDKLHCESLIITLGENGMMVFDKNGKVINLPTLAKEVFDVTGAGDTVISVVAMMFACGHSIIQAAEVANHAAGIVVGKLGTATVLPDELKAAFIGR